MQTSLLLLASLLYPVQLAGSRVDLDVARFMIIPEIKNVHFGRRPIPVYDITLWGVKINNNFINIHRIGIEDCLVSICN